MMETKSSTTFKTMGIAKLNPSRESEAAASAVTLFDTVRLVEHVAMISEELPLSAT
eukprot:CAMPEP_0204178484 /NCGR_PEP_ID=MMETSP0361-20130328/49354_1 /ASSEMBLY_ACC=CAM_ASM_000343 /TAXON_ID=268821 /ORGANISM="Scrippsiella Hangoei, Strain SHTV-5" /LENGTH=55 /DNA_ID=CAMNT_0051137607 /DNA_START=68 /DNA_END=231 /DNA_ORIENTATION=+